MSSNALYSLNRENDSTGTAGHSSNARYERHSEIEH